jgi:hypothetical protein
VEFICDEFGIGELCSGKVLERIAEIEHHEANVFSALDVSEGFGKLGGRLSQNQLLRPSVLVIDDKGGEFGPPVLVSTERVLVDAENRRPGYWRFLNRSSSCS